MNCFLLLACAGEVKPTDKELVKLLSVWWKGFNSKHICLKNVCFQLTRVICFCWFHSVVTPLPINKGVPGSFPGAIVGCLYNRELLHCIYGFGCLIDLCPCPILLEEAPADNGSERSYSFLHRSFHGSSWISSAFWCNSFITRQSVRVICPVSLTFSDRTNITDTVLNH